MRKLDIRGIKDKILFIIVFLILIVVIAFILLSTFLPKEFAVRRAAILGLILNFCGTLKLATTLIKPDKEMKKIASGTTWNGDNPNLAKDMFLNRRAAFIGLILISFGFIFQFLDILISHYQQ